MKRAVFLVLVSLVAALVGVWLFEMLLSLLNRYDWLGSSINADTNELRDVRWLYVFAYLTVFFLALVFRWPASPKQWVLASLVVLVGGLLPLVSVLVRWYATANLPATDILGREQLALASLLVTHSVALSVVNGLYHLRNIKRPVQSQVIPT